MGKKFFRAALAVLLSVALSVSFCACGLFSPTTDPDTHSVTNPTEDSRIRDIYDLYVANCAEKGETALTYEEWLASIQGEDGKDGDTPYIGKNGNWFIGNADTGVKAEGVDGATPYIGSNGNWFIGTTDTGIKAEGEDGARGNGWLYGDGAPQNSIGQDGDLYLDFLTWNVYTKENGKWKFHRCMVNGSEGPGGTMTDSLQFHFLELGNKFTGDCTLVKVGDVEVLIDAGSRKDSGPVISSYIDDYVEGDLDYVVVTHAHQDHIAGFVDNGSDKGVFSNFKCGTIIDYARSNSFSQIKAAYEDARDNEVSADGAKRYTALQCWNNEGGAQRSYDLGSGVTMNILYQTFYENKASEENDYSVCVMFSEGDNHFLFTGDLEKAGEESLAKSNELPHCKLFKGGHHGSSTSTNECLLEKITPEMICICTCAGTAEYADSDPASFPTQEMINRIAPYTDKVYITSLATNAVFGTGKTWGVASMNGNIVVTWNGATLSVNCSNNNTILKDTDWFAQHRTCPAAWQ